MEDKVFGFWVCSCCHSVFNGETEQPINIDTNDLFQCALCDISNAECQLSGVTADEY